MPNESLTLLLIFSTIPVLMGTPLLTGRREMSPEQTLVEFISTSAPDILQSQF
jgi:hypothetical protein